MANEYSDEEIWGAPAQGTNTVLSDEDVWGSPAALATPTVSPRLDISRLALPQLMQAYRDLPRDDPQREFVKRRILELNTGPQMTQLQSGVAGATDALSFGLSDEINAGIDAGLGWGNYEDNLRANRQQMKTAEADNPGSYTAGQIGGGLVQAVATGGGSLTNGVAGLVRNNLIGGATRAVPAATRLGRVAQTAGNVGRTAGAAGVSGAVYGFNSGEGGVGNRLQNAAEVGLTSAAVAPVVGKVVKSMGGVVNKIRGQSPIWSSDEIEKMSQSLYRQATQEGAIVKPNTIANVGRRMNAEVLGDINYSPDIPTGFDAARKAMDVVQRVFIGRAPTPGTAPFAPRVPGSTPGLVGGKSTTLEEMEAVRRRLTKLAGSTQDDDEARMIFKMRSVLDEAIDSLTPADMANGSASAFNKLTEARKLWSVKSQTEWAEEMLRRAKASAGQYSVSKGENAIRTEARNAAKNAKKMRRVGDTVEAATEKVANPGFVQNMVREAGKWSPLSGVRGPAAGLFSPAIGIPLMGVGAVAQGVSHALTKKNFRNLQRTIQRSLGDKPVPVPVGEQISRRAIPYALPGLLNDGEGDAIPFITSNTTGESFGYYTPKPPKKSK